MRLLPPQVPMGLALAMDGCKLGGRRVVTIPARLGFGDKPPREPGVIIPRNAMLIYDIELIEIVDDLQVGILREGTGPALQYGQTGTFHYTGVLAKNGEVFDSSEFGEPRPFPIVNPGVIPGWWARAARDQGSRRSAG